MEKIRKDQPTGDSYASSCNACKQCTPLGACIAFKGIEGVLPMLHGSQGCATYIRRYLISHFREPVDIASSNFSEETTIFGGKPKLQHRHRQHHQPISPQGDCYRQHLPERDHR